jgi:O-antigen ligase
MSSTSTTSTQHMGRRKQLTSAFFPAFLFLIFALIAWFPEFSQTDWNVHTAEDAPSLYNFRPIHGITASVFDYLFAMIVAVWMAKVVLPQPKKVLRAPLAKPMLAFLAVWILNLLHGLWRGNEAYYALREFRVGAYFVLVYLMVVTTCGGFRDIRKFVSLSIVMAAAIGIYGVVRYILGIGAEFGDVNLIYYDVADSIVLYIVLLIIASFSIEQAIPRGKGLLALFLVLPMVFSFVFSYRRGAWVAFVVGLLFLIFSYPGRAQFRRRVFLGVFVPTASLIALIAAVPAVRSAGLDFVVTRVQSIFDVSEDASNVFRILDAQNALYSFLQHPIAGVGAGGRYDLEFLAKDPATMAFMEEVSRTSHDGYLYVLFKAGIVGFVAYIVVFAKFLRSWFRTRDIIMLPKERALLMAIGAIFIAFMMNNVTEPVSDTLRPAILLSFVMSWGAVVMRELRGRSRIQFQGNVGQAASQ